MSSPSEPGSRPVSIELPHDLHGRLLERSLREGRPLADLVVFLLESGVRGLNQGAPDRPVG